MNREPSKTPDDLHGLQSWLQGAIMTPWDTGEAELEQVLAAGSGNLDRAQRLGIYTHSYQGRLVECMESEFPVLRLALGKPLFVRFASEYLVANPSRSYTLAALGERFPRYLRQTRPSGDDELWPEFVIELATLERLFSEVYHAEGHEESRLIAANDTKAILSEPGVRWMHGNFPVDDYFIAARSHLRNEEHSEPPEFPAPEPISLLLFRRNYVVQLRRVSPNALPPAEPGRRERR